MIFHSPDEGRDRELHGDDDEVHALAPAVGSGLFRSAAMIGDPDRISQRYG
jgi:hypothetical protein